MIDSDRRSGGLWKMVFSSVSLFLILLAFVGASGWWTHHCGAHWVQLFSFSVLHPSLRSFIRSLGMVSCIMPTYEARPD